MSLIWTPASLPGMFSGLSVESAAMTVASIQDVEPILLENQRLHRDATQRKGDLHRVASIPLAIVEKWMFEENISVFREDDWPAILRKLDDPEYLFLRTAPGRLSRRPVRLYPSLGVKRDPRPKPRGFWDGS